MLDKKSVFVILLAVIIATVVAFGIFKKDFNHQIKDIARPEQTGLLEENKESLLKNEENYEENKQKIEDSNEVQAKNILKQSMQAEIVQKNINRQKTNVAPKELTVGEMFKNKEKLNSNIPQSRPRSEVVLINEEIKILSPEKYSFK